MKLAGMEALALTYINDDAPDKAANVLAEEGVYAEVESRLSAAMMKGAEV